MSETEPVDTSLPWGRRREIDLPRSVGHPIQRIVDHARQHPLVVPGTGEVQRYSIMTKDYEPNRPMAPDPKSIIAKKGLRPAKKDIYKEVDAPDRIVVISVLVCLVGIIAITGYLLTLG